jgi:hypothetical protein
MLDDRGFHRNLAIRPHGAIFGQQQFIDEVRIPFLFGIAPPLIRRDDRSGGFRLWRGCGGGERTAKTIPEIK